MRLLFIVALVLVTFGIFTSRQLRNLEKALGGNVRVCDRTALILDIFNQRAATHEAALQASISTQHFDFVILDLMGIKTMYKNAFISHIHCGTFVLMLLVALAQMEYQLPRLTKMWTHLERQAGGKVKGMGEKQIEVDKRILRTQVSCRVSSPTFFPCCREYYKCGSSQLY
ncbi:hypothetical protein GW17_00027359 [Ensete ventricosum]|nr:hypothetical protein GW17_00027359 [Ensete ventricosum]